ncbi:MAG: type III-A CRISPR-associated protein Csm2 [Oscillospiraceae bacterium]|jgi:CRISPR-associated protein Csm2|nr:type III-A CRISPR-associated protein Csm2 [Oscillospiraceae bacterium]
MDEDYVTRAETAVKNLDKDRSGKFILTTSKIRSLMSMMNSIYNDALTETETTLSPELSKRVQHMNVRMVYEAGREDSVKDFLNKTRLRDELNKVGDDRAKFLDFCRYFEALVAFHRFQGGND